MLPICVQITADSSKRRSNAAGKLRAALAQTLLLRNVCMSSCQERTVTSIMLLERSHACIVCFLHVTCKSQQIFDFQLLIIRNTSNSNSSFFSSCGRISTEGLQMGWHEKDGPNSREWKCRTWVWIMTKLTTFWTMLNGYNHMFWRCCVLAFFSTHQISNKKLSCCWHTRTTRIIDARNFELSG